MIRRSFATAVASLLAVATFQLAGSAQADGIAPLSVDPKIAAVLGSVSAKRLEALDTRLVGFGTRNLLSEKLNSRTRGVYAARDWVAEQFREIGRSSGGRLAVDFDTFVQPKTDRIPREVETSSVIATLPGDDPQRGVIVMSSHYDSRNSDGSDATRDAPGADDNGSGTIAVLEAARALAPMHFRATLIFATFDGEEQGLFGSAHYAKLLKTKGVRVEANLNNDIIGASLGPNGEQAPNEVRLFSEALPPDAVLRTVNLTGSENDSPSRELARAVREIDGAYLPTMTVRMTNRSDRFQRGGDQQSFAAQGFPAIRYVERFENYDHQHQDIRVENGVQYGDLLKYVDFEYVARVTRLNVAALATLALAPAVPQADVSNKQLSYDTTLSWHPVADASHYEVVWRDTVEPYWTHARDVGAVTSYVVKGLSKDDWIFGVRAVDAAGHKSVAAYPQPLR
ncbi:MAG: M20/M25/M40 family metallo-hydrolase [Candidatus Eremiobacteraeota bacterium]|nr:M20/M25/M40 family metallo-hydrolase [Candidatus Eremiobacteraeota bacterium]